MICEICLCKERHFYKHIDLFARCHAKWQIVSKLMKMITGDYAKLILFSVIAKKSYLKTPIKIASHNFL